MIGTPEIIGIVVVVIILFGAKRIPELGKSLGQGIKEFRKSTKTIMEDDEERADNPKSDTKS
ncbi:MAG: twin-arginine translocase TatA/TatE family subunit [Armatimonadota bacterium]